MSDTLFATRLNSFKVNEAQYWPGKNGNVTTVDVLERASTVTKLNAVDHDFPDHLSGHTKAEIGGKLTSLGIHLNGYAMRYFSLPAFKLGAFTNPDKSVRQAAIDLSKKGIDALAKAGGSLMTLWMGQGGFDYSFQADYARLWDNTIAAVQEVADHNNRVDINIEYKPNEPRSFSLMPDVATTLLALKDETGPTPASHWISPMCSTRTKCLPMLPRLLIAIHAFWASILTTDTASAMTG